MKKILLPVFILLSVVSYCQTNNSWIDYSKTYFKFKVGATGLYRISQPTLSSLGLGNISADQFQLWRNGEEVRLYTTSVSGPLASSGYIEFWGLMNDGKKDTKLYLNSDFQMSDRYSLETDTASCFLTVNTAGNNLRYTDAANNVAGNILSAEPYFMNTKGYYYRDKINPGFAQVVGEYVYSSSYDMGEGWTSNDIGAGAGFALTQVIDNLNLYPTGPSAYFRIAATGNALNSRNIKVTLANTVVLDTAMDYFNYLKKQVTNIPLSVFLSPDFIGVSIQNNSPVSSDRMSVSFIELTYPSKFNFNASKNFSFELPATTTGNYLVIDNFNYGSVAPVLLDINSGKRYTADISTPGKVKIVLPPSLNPIRKFVLMSEDASNINSVLNITQRNFVNYSLASNQANYLIISNKALFDNGAGQNYVEQYRAYRASAAGGSFNAKIFDIDQLNDQFAFGIKHHPFSIKDFLQFAKTNFSSTPKFVFIIGKGVTYVDYSFIKTDPQADKLNLVTTFGYPASDIRLASDYNSLVPDISIGRLSVINGNEIANYLQKMQQFEQAQASTSQTVADKGWMKNMAHVIGGKDVSESDLFKFYMDGFKRIIEDTLYGAKVETFSKSSTAAVQIFASQRIEDLFKEGMSMITYFGHSSANTLEFNLSSPENYYNQGKYPFFNVNGCIAGNNYSSNMQRLSGDFTLSEKYVLTNQRGSIAFLASSHLGIPPFLNNYQREFYKELGVNSYGSAAGTVIKNTIRNLGGANPNLDFYTRMHAEEMNLNGDPALKINPHPKPDYVIEDPMITINPNIVSVADNSFGIKINMLNIGKAINDSIRVTVKRTLPDNSVTTLYNRVIVAIKYSDSINLTIPINPITDKGQNKITVTLDADNHVDEMSELNNTVTKQFFIFEDEVRPVYPYNYAIVNKQNFSYYGSTANPLTGQRQIVMEVDTTELFNSPFKKSFSTTTTGGVIQFTSSILYVDSTVYYWRMAMQPVSGPYIWNTSSFVYLPNGGEGFNQSHYYQFLKDTYKQIHLGSDRVFDFDVASRSLNIRTGLYPYYDFDRIDVSLDFAKLENYGCKYNSLQFYVFDSSTLQPMPNFNVGANGRFGSWLVCSRPVRYFFEFPYTDPLYRKRAMDFIDSIPAGKYVAITNLGITSNTSFIKDWMADTATLGSGNSLYHKLKSIGFTQIDSFTTNLPFLYFYQKGITSYPSKQFIGPTVDQQIGQSFLLKAKYKDGEIESPQFGPAKAWKALHWRGTDLEASVPDSVSIEVYGITIAGNKIKLATVRPATDTSLAFINAAVYPYITLKMLNSDQINTTPNQLRYWRVNADYVPEGGIAPNILFQMKDTVEIGENINFAIAFKNISQTAFDSLKVKFIITDKDNQQHIINIPKQKALQADSTLIVSYTIDSKNYYGMNTLFVEVNPDNDQPEQYHFNNFIYKNFFVKGDKINPLIDVTFDGVHILNRDIVSARPHIVIKLKDESKYLALSDTSLLKVQLRLPDGTLKTYRIDNDTVKFTPANLANGENTATIDFTPLLRGDDAEYELIVSGKDASNNAAGQIAYHVIFRVINKPMISNLLNYPNPFTTSTAFVFTVTGTQPPQNIRIQILTITGKIVREITKDELGPIHIGRNITDFKWDGTDMYGQKLANGVYLYRVLTNLNGKSLDKFKDTGDTSDKYFTKGYGKMYFMNSSKY
ncbi:MAG: C25 family cysteine peptidase [Bacteroidota bacterium]|nr:C25 family cysteine peptidase [Bacteroidota bacterium]